MCLLCSCLYTALILLGKIGSKFGRDTLEMDIIDVMYVLSSESLGMQPDDYDNILSRNSFSRLYHYFLLMSMHYKMFKGKKMLKGHCFYHVKYVKDCEMCSYKITNLEQIVRTELSDLTDEQMQSEISYER